MSEWYDKDDALTTARKRAKWDEDAAAIAQAQDRIAELEAALKPFAQLLLSETTDEIDPAGMYVLRVDIEDADVTGREVIAARKALSM